MIGTQELALPLNGGGLGGGVAGMCEEEPRSAPTAPLFADTTATPPTPALPPLRGKGAFAHPAHAKGAVARARRFRREMPLTEKLLWEALRLFKMNIRRQAPMGAYTLDFVHHASKLVIEVDSGWHDLPENQLRDAKRDAWLNSQGYAVTRIPDGDVLRDADAVANEIRLMILSRKGDA